MVHLYNLASELHSQLTSSPTDYQNSSSHCLLYLLQTKHFHTFSCHTLCMCRPKPHRSSQIFYKILPKNLAWSSSCSDTCKIQHPWGLEAASLLSSPGGLLPHAYLKFPVLFFILSLFRAKHPRVLVQCSVLLQRTAKVQIFVVAKGKSQLLWRMWFSSVISKLLNLALLSSFYLQWSPLSRPSLYKIPWCWN